MGYSTNSILFNGSTQYATGGNVLGFEYNQAFSVSCWVKTTDTDGYLVSKRGGATTYRGWGLLTNGGAIGFSLSNDFTGGAYARVNTDTTSWNDDAWHHVCATSSGSGTVAGMLVYVDGQLEATTPQSDTLAGNTIVSTDPLNVAGRTNGSVLLAGSVDEVAVYNRTLSATEVQWIYNLGNANNLLHANAPLNLVSWWQMGENESGGTLPDQQSSNDLTLVNSPTIQTDAPSTTYDLSYGGVPPTYAFEAEDTGTVPGQAVDLTYTSGLPGGGGGPTITKKYKMRAQQQLTPVPVPAPGYVTWIATGTPDFAGSGFATGTPTPSNPMVAGSAIIADEWEE